MSKIELADGTVFEGEAGYTGPTLRLYVSMETAQEQLPNFIDKSKIDPITFYYSAYKDIYHGFEAFSHMEYDQASEKVNVILNGTDTHAEYQIPTVPIEYLPK